MVCELGEWGEWRPPFPSRPVTRLDGVRDFKVFDARAVVQRGARGGARQNIFSFRPAPRLQPIGKSQALLGEARRVEGGDDRPHRAHVGHQIALKRGSSEDEAARNAQVVPLPAGILHVLLGKVGGKAERRVVVGLASRVQVVVLRVVLRTCAYGPSTRRKEKKQKMK